jgi:hypothetical protein
MLARLMCLFLSLSPFLLPPLFPLSPVSRTFHRLPFPPPAVLSALSCCSTDMSRRRRVQWRTGCVEGMKFWSGVYVILRTLII